MKDRSVPMAVSVLFCTIFSEDATAAAAMVGSMGAAGVENERPRFSRCATAGDAAGAVAVGVVGEVTAIVSGLLEMGKGRDC